MFGVDSCRLWPDDKAQKSLRGPVPFHEREKRREKWVTKTRC